jgi:bifunctional N-acetylglucosamine-1-phosphate-uridyltransferase/glucosamine-1-phosphate-acetyltransferase GlmU-like protein
MEIRLLRKIIIPCAGKSSRMKSSVPKQLLKIKGRAAINYLLEEVNKYFETIIIPIPNDKSSKDLFNENIEDHFLSKINFIKSEPGSGDGQAVLDGLSSFKANGSLIFVCWGDTFIIDSPTAFEKHLNISDDADIFVPLTFDRKPYVKYMLKKNSELIEQIHLSIDGSQEINWKDGLADQSIFIVKDSIIKQLQEYKNDLNGSPLNFLRFMNTFSKSLKIKALKMPKRISKSYNIASEFLDIESFI